MWNIFNCSVKTSILKLHKIEVTLLDDDFISDLSSRSIRKYLLENKTLDLSTAVDHAMAFDVARLFTATVNAITGIGPSSFCRSHVCHYSSKKQVPFLWMR